MLELDNVAFRQGQFTLSAHFGVRDAQRIAVIGPSGAGKSTLLMGLAGFVQTHDGTVAYNGAPITHDAPSARPFAVLFQDNNLFPHMTAKQNVGLALRPSLRLSNTEAAKVDEALSAVGLSGLGDRKPAALSGGQQSRAALARVLLQNKPWLLLDEPFAALGPALKSEMLDLVARLCDTAGIGLLMVTHDPNDARRICETSIVVADTVAQPPQATGPLLDAPPAALRAYLGAP